MVGISTLFEPGCEWRKAMVDRQRVLRGFRVSCLCLLVLLIVVVDASTQTLATIRGKVFDDTGGAVPGVSVTVSSPALLAGGDTITDGEGAYNFSNLPVGQYKLVFSLIGFQQLIRENIILTAGFSATINVSL